VSTINARNLVEDIRIVILRSGALGKDPKATAESLACKSNVDRR
jgi:hypothetical protein